MRFLLLFDLPRKGSRIAILLDIPPPFWAITNYSNEDFLVAFADDTTLGILGKTECDIKSSLVALFERVISWLNANYLV